VQPISVGPYQVGSTNFEIQDLPTAETEKHLIGASSADGDLYVADLLLHPEDCPSFTISVPDDNSLFGRHAGKNVNFVAYVLYPTTGNNDRPDYVFPYTNTGDRTFPHMQRKGEAPILRDPAARYPLIIYSHGYNAHGLWDLAHLKLLASQGYIVAAIQHGDGRNTIQNCMGERPLAVSRLLDLLLASPDFGPAIDKDRIGISGASMGGFTVLSTIGGGCNDSPLLQPDKRFRAAFGLVPFVGGNFGLYPFGYDYASMEKINCPFFAVYSENDASVPKPTVETALHKVKGPCTMVMLKGHDHNLNDVANREAQTYEVLFFNAWLRDDKAAAALLYGDMTVQGGPEDLRTWQQCAPVPACK
jgi:predicted dienelactone hydrolase